MLTGAGVSAESGVPTFRSSGSPRAENEPTPLWEKYDPHELACAEGFLKRPEVVWQWYDWRRRLVESVEPNAGHLALVELETLIVPRSLTVITQNVDRLHQRAGSQNIIELHGNILTFRCFDHGHQAGDVPYNLSAPPTCGETCGSKLRPNVVWFGESLDPDCMEDALNAARRCDLFIVIGTSAVVQPAISLAYASQGNGAKLVEINLERTMLSNHADLVLLGKSGSVLPSLLALVNTNK